ncbi:MAG: hypothetical protein J5950_00360 [Clostridia bacterium]|nr:hypothetical protein [Clostridia bacterium]
MYATAANRGLPFELVPPANVSATWLEGNDSPTTTSIAYTKHTMYFRMRFVVTTYKDTEDGTKATYYYSDWSNTTAAIRILPKAQILRTILRTRLRRPARSATSALSLSACAYSSGC